MSRKRSSDTKVIKFDNQDMLVTSSSTDGKSYSPTRARPKLRVRIKKWHGIAHWTWNCGEEDDLCGICQSPYEGVAPNCKYPGDECPVVWGKCGHSFHLQCVTTWLTSKSTCPMCRSEWEYGQSNDERNGGGP